MVVHLYRIVVFDYHCCFTVVLIPTRGVWCCKTQTQTVTMSETDSSKYRRNPGFLTKVGAAVGVLGVLGLLLMMHAATRQGGDTVAAPPGHPSLDVDREDGGVDDGVTTPVPTPSLGGGVRGARNAERAGDDPVPWTTGGGKDTTQNDDGGASEVQPPAHTAGEDEDEDDDDDGMDKLKGGEVAGGPEAEPEAAAPPLEYNVWEGRELSDKEMNDKPSVVHKVYNVKPSYRIRLYPKGDEHISRAAMKMGWYGPLQELEYMLRDIDNGLVVDAGANVGFVTLYAAELGHNVRAFEAQTDNYHMLLSSLRLNQHAKDRVRVYHRAAHWDSKPMQLMTKFRTVKGRANSGLGTLANANEMLKSDDTEAKFETVWPAAIDDVVGPSEHVDLLKIDVEGCGCHVLKSADKALSSGRVSYIMIEVTPMDVCGCSHKDSMTRLLDQGFTPNEIMFKPQRRGKPPVVDRLRRMSKSQLLSGEIRDVVFVHSSAPKN